MSADLFRKQQGRGQNQLRFQVYETSSECLCIGSTLAICQAQRGDGEGQGLSGKRAGVCGLRDAPADKARVFVAGAHAPPHGAARLSVRSPACEQSQHESAHGERGDAAQYVTPPLACLRPRMAPRRACPAPQCRSCPAHPAAAGPCQHDVASRDCFPPMG
jgi:hypothetical protein